VNVKQAQVRKIALSLPEVTEEPHFHRTSFRVRGKIFATVIPDEPFLNVMVGESTREPALSVCSHCVEKLFWGKKVAGLTVDLREAKPALVAELLAQAWREKAPKSLHANLEVRSR
jgi:hypothetical protein